MKRSLFLWIVVIVCLFSTKSQDKHGRDKHITQQFYVAQVLDSIFFNQLDSIVKEKDLSIYRYIEIERNNCSQNSPKISILIRGFDTPMNNKLYQVKYKDMVYFFDDRLNKILIQKVGSKYINHSAYVNMRDFDSPILILNYTNKKLTIEADSRVDRYLVE